MTWRANSSYAGRQGNRAGERYMRLRLFDRIRRLAHSRRPPAEATPGVSGVQGRHRRDRRRGPAPSGPPAELAHTATPWPGGSPAPQAPFSPGGAPPRSADPAPADRAPTGRAPTGRAPADRAPADRPAAERTGAGSGPSAPGPRRGTGPTGVRA